MLHSTRDILVKVRNGTISVNAAEKVLKFDALSVVGDLANIDINRHLRRGIPEIVYAKSKSIPQLNSIVEKLISESETHEYSAPIVLSKVKPEQFRALRLLFKRKSGDVGFRSAKTDYYPNANMVVIEKNITHLNNAKKMVESGRVALLAAGTSDIPALDETEIVLGILGCRTVRFNDVGVAALHRLRWPLEKIQKFDPDALVVAAGMEAALPSLVAALSEVPVIGLPTSVGYGYGRDGESALMSMLQACPLGICVVNIDGGVAAGVVASLIARRCASRAT